MNITLDWLGTATFRLVIDDVVIFLDAYVDRIPSAPPVGISAAAVERADFVLVGHSHFDHLAGGEVIAANTGAKIIGSNETCRVMRDCGIPRDQLLPSQGGERHRLATDVTVRVFPSLHACLWAGARGAMDEPMEGDLGLCEHERAAQFGERSAWAGGTRDPEHLQRMIEHLRTSTGSRSDGGPLVYLIETPAGTVFFQDTTGSWTGIISELHADVAILAASGRPNHDGEPYQGSLGEFITMEARLLGASTVVLGHHDNWGGVSGFTPLDTGPLRDMLGGAERVRLIEPGYLEGTPILT